MPTENTPPTHALKNPWLAPKKRQKYRSFEELSAVETEGVDFRVRKRVGHSGVAVISIHGGGIEPGTTEIAEAVARDRHSFYTFSGLKPVGNFDLHITSRRFDEPRGEELVAEATTVLSIHGCGDDVPMIYIGGQNVELRRKVETALVDAGFKVRKAVRFPGLSPMNICNRCRSGEGVQLEFCAGLRRMMFENLGRPDRKKPTPLFDRLVEALRAALVE